jgi:single-strand DNA-binding protein
VAGVAKVTLIGNLGRDPETRYTPSGAMNVSFSVAVSRRWNDQGGQQQERTTWFRVTGWGRLAEIMDQLTQSGALGKGRQVFVLGTIELQEYQNQQGETRQSLDVRADEFQLLGSRQEFEAGGGRPSGGTRSGAEDTGSPSDIDDVPF